MMTSLIAKASVYAYLVFGPCANQMDFNVTVVNSQTKKPIPGARVEIEALSFIVDDCPGGEVWHLIADKNGYLHLNTRVDCPLPIYMVSVRAWNLDYSKSTSSAYAVNSARPIGLIFSRDVDVSGGTIKTVSFLPGMRSHVLELKPVSPKEQEFRKRWGKKYWATK